jgi:hypothetical protein
VYIKNNVLAVNFADKLCIFISLAKTYLPPQPNGKACMRYQVLAAANMKMRVSIFSSDRHPFFHCSSQDSTWSHRFLHLHMIHRPDDGGSTRLRNVGLL